MCPNEGAVQDHLLWRKFLTSNQCHIAEMYNMKTKVTMEHQYEVMRDQLGCNGNKKIQQSWQTSAVAMRLLVAR